MAAMTAGGATGMLRMGRSAAGCDSGGGKYGARKQSAPEREIHDRPQFEFLKLAEPAKKADPDSLTLRRRRGPAKPRRRKPHDRRANAALFRPLWREWHVFGPFRPVRLASAGPAATLRPP